MNNDPLSSIWFTIDKAMKLLQLVEIKAERNNLQYFTAGLDALDEAVSSLDDVISYLQDVTTSSDEELIMETSPWDSLKQGDAVSHNKFGRGVISSKEGGYITVSFAQREARFRFPDAFEGGFLTINE